MSATNGTFGHALDNCANDEWHSVTSHMMRASGFCVLSPPNKALSPPNWNLKHYK